MPPNANSNESALDQDHDMLMLHDTCDPLDSVAASQVGDDDEESEDSDVENQQHAGPQNAGVKPGSASDQGINLMLTPQGIRTLLGRPKVSRPRPLLKIFCKGCGRSTHDEDELLPKDFQECLATYTFESHLS